MSYSPEPGRDPRPEPWASPSTAGGHDTQQFGGAPAGSTRVDEAVDVTPDRPTGDTGHSAGAGHDTPADPRPADAPAGHGSYADPSSDAATPDYGPPPVAGAAAGSAHPVYGQPGYGQTPYDQPTQPAYQSSYQSSYGPPPVPPQRAGRRGPGWTGVVAVGAGAALLSSLLTAGLVDHDKGTSTALTTSGSSSSQSSSTAPNSAPLVTNGAPAPDWVAVARAVEPSVVSVRVTAGTSGDEGSGIVYDGKGHVLTNHHVISAAAGGGGQVTVVLSDGRGYPATIVGSDPSTDLAVLQVKNPPADLKPAAFADSSAVKVGNAVMAVGNPLGLSDTVTTGIVSALDQPVRTQQQSPTADPAAGGDSVVTNAIQTDAAVNPGNSGGALVDANGRVIGVTSSIASLGATGGQSGNIGLGFAIPSNEARDVADQLLNGGKVQHAFLGIRLSDGTASVDGAQRQAAVVASVTGGSAAEKGGLRTGDRIVAVDGAALEGADSLVARIRALRPGTAVTLTVVRDGSKTDLKITLGTQPASNG